VKLPKVVFIYVGTIVVPAVVLVWLGIQSFERQRQALATLTAEKLTAEIERQAYSAAETAFTTQHHPMAKHFFIIEGGSVTHPALYASPPRTAPPEFLQAEREEFEVNRPDLALDSYRKLAAAHKHESLAWSRIARTLAKLGRNDEARSVWRKVATAYPDERDLSNRPFGIVAAIAAGDTNGLYDQISSGRWDLSADQAEYFLTQLDPKRTSAYLDQFRFARELNEQFKVPGSVRENEIYSYTFGPHRIFYRTAGRDRIEGLEVNQDWINQTLRARSAHELGIAESARHDQFVYGGAVALVLVILSAGVLLLLRDISREARTNHMRSDFVSSISHELKTPITLIRLYSETLLRHSELDAQQRSDFHRIIVRESDRLSRLIDQVLSFSRVERNDERYQFEDGDVVPVVTRLVSDYRAFVERGGFSIQCDLPESAPSVRFDKAALSQAVINLLDNAVKYSGQARDISVRLHVSDGEVTLEVEDHGIGIAIVEQNKIFERFYRTPNGSGKGGYGLGLFMVRHIMEAHGGRAEVESEPGRGSRFRLIFPAGKVWANTASS